MITVSQLKEVYNLMAKYSTYYNYNARLVKSQNSKKAL